MSVIVPVKASALVYPDKRYVLVFVLALLGALGYAQWFTGLPWGQAFVLGAWYWLSLHPWRAAPWIGWVVQTVAFLSGLSWLHTSLHDFGGLPSVVAWLALGVLAAFLALFPLMAVGCFRRWHGALAPKPLWAQTLLLATLYTFAEWVRGSVVLGGFPWLATAYAYVDTPWQAIAPWLGVYGMGWLVCWAVALGVFGLQAKNLRPWLAVASLWGLVWLLSHFHWGAPVGEPLHVRLVQGNVPQAEKFHPAHALSHVYRQLQLATSTSPRAHPPDFILLPETTVPGLHSDFPASLWAQVMAHAPHSTLGLGVAYAHPSADSLPLASNSILQLPPGRRVEDLQQHRLLHYDKHHLVPFGESLPLGLGWFARRLNIPLGEFTPGQARQANWQVGAQVMAPTICYEDVFGHRLRQMLWPQADNPGATALFNISNLAWFGEGAAQAQHLQMARLRSIELARPTVRVGNTGGTAYIDAQGRVLAQLPFYTAGVLDVQLQGYEGLTPYAYWGDWAWLGVVLVLLLGGGLYQRRKNHTKT